MNNTTSDKNVANIEDDVEILESIVKVHNDFLQGVDKESINEKEIRALEHLLAEREQKDKRIQELENENVSKQKAYNNCYYEYKHYKQFESIPVQKVKDKIEKHKFAKKYFEKEYDNKHYEDDGIRARDFYGIVTQDRIIQVLEELLEDK